MRSRTPVGLPEFDTVPCRVRSAEELIQTEALVSRLEIAQAPSGVQQGHETMNVCMFCDIRPVEPAGFVILAVCVIVSTLCSPHFVTHEHHRHAHREHGDGQKVFHLPISELLQYGIVCGTLNVTIPA